MKQYSNKWEKKNKGVNFTAGHQDYSGPFLPTCQALHTEEEHLAQIHF